MDHYSSFKKLLNRLVTRPYNTCSTRKSRSSNFFAVCYSSKSGSSDEEQKIILNSTISTLFKYRFQSFLAEYAPEKNRFCVLRTHRHKTGPFLKDTCKKTSEPMSKKMRTWSNSSTLMYRKLNYGSLQIRSNSKCNLSSQLPSAHLVGAAR